VRQPLGAPIDLDRPDDELLAFAKSFEATKGRARSSPSVVIDPTRWRVEEENT